MPWNRSWCYPWYTYSTCPWLQRPDLRNRNRSKSQNGTQALFAEPSRRNFSHRSKITVKLYAVSRFEHASSRDNALGENIQRLSTASKREKSRPPKQPPLRPQHPRSSWLEQAESGPSSAGHCTRKGKASGTIKGTVTPRNLTPAKNRQSRSISILENDSESSPQRPSLPHFASLGESQWRSPRDCARASTKGLQVLPLIRSL